MVVERLSQNALLRSTWKSLRRGDRLNASYLPANIVLDVGYVGSKGMRLIVTYLDLNIPLQIVDPRTPGLPSLNSRRPDQHFSARSHGDKSIGNSIYHALQAKGERRLGKGVTFLTAYT